MVALKIIKLGMDTRQVVARFEAERQAWPSWTIRTWLGYRRRRRTGHGPYLVMELVKGIAITEYSDKNHLNIPTLWLFGQAARPFDVPTRRGSSSRHQADQRVGGGTDDRPLAEAIDFVASPRRSKHGSRRDAVYRVSAAGFGYAHLHDPGQAAGGLRRRHPIDMYSLGVLTYYASPARHRVDARRAALQGVCRDAADHCEVEPRAPSSRVSTQEFDSLPRVAARERLTTEASCDCPRRAGLDRHAVSGKGPNPPLPDRWRSG